MSDYMKKVQSGDRLRIPARAYNAFIDTARAHAQREQDQQRHTRGHRPSADVVLVRNDSGEDRHRFTVLGLDQPIIRPDDNLDQFKSRVAFVGVEPTENHRGRYALLLEPLKPGSIGHALLSGVGVAQIEVVDEQHAFADIVPADAEAEDPPDPFILHTTSGGSGYGGEAQILWKEEGTGLRWAVLRLGPGATATFAARITAVAHVAIDHADYGKMAWQEVRWNPEADDGEGGTVATWETVENGRSGAIADPTHAREINGRPMVAPGTIVLLSATAGGHWFSMDSAPTYEALGDLADAQYQTTDLDQDEQPNKWFDRDHVHHGGPTSRYDPQAELVPMPGAHSLGWARAWFARFVSKLTGGEDPTDENYEEEHHDLTLGVERRVVHGDPAGHFQWVGPPGESEVEDGPPEIVLRHKDPGTTDWTITLEDDEQNVLGTITFDEKGHNNQTDHTITIPATGECPDITGSASATTGSPGTSASADLTVTPGPDCSFDFDFNFTIPRGEQGEEGPQGPQGPEGPKGDDGDPADITITGDPPWINVTGSNTANVTLQHGGPGALVDDQSIIALASVTGEDESAGGATLSLTAQGLQRDLVGHIGATADDDDNNVELSVPQVLGDLADAALTSPQDEQVLTYDGGAGAWINQDLPAVPDLEDVVGDG
ncbi:MAG: hypothetical protein WD534_18140, partial [Phycisphaeraceae bacterium]